jgi:hypothetical protein
MLTQICQYLRNWFVRDKYFGSFTISGGVLTYADGTALPLLSGQYFRIVGSILNDGVHKNAASDVLADETFSGAVWSMAVPPDFLALAQDIATWCTDNAAAINSPYQSETVGGYTYKLKDGGGSNSAAGAGTWEAQFASRLGPWRKI